AATGTPPGTVTTISAFGWRERLHLESWFASHPSRREPEVHHVAVGHHVVLALEPQFSRIARARLAAERGILVVADRLGANEAALEIGGDDAGGLRRARAARHRPGARLLGAGGEERDEVEQRVAGADQPVEARFVQPHMLKVLVALVVRQQRDLRLDFRRDRDTARAFELGTLLHRARKRVAG